MRMTWRKANIYQYQAEHGRWIVNVIYDPTNAGWYVEGGYCPFPVFFHTVNLEVLPNIADYQKRHFQLAGFYSTSTAAKSAATKALKGKINEHS